VVYVIRAKRVSFSDALSSISQINSVVRMSLIEMQFIKKVGDGMKLCLDSILFYSHC
jgi:hypothetical protein